MLDSLTVSALGTVRDTSLLKDDRIVTSHERFYPTTKGIRSVLDTLTVLLHSADSGLGGGA